MSILVCQCVQVHVCVCMIVTISVLDENLEQEKAVDIEEKNEEVPLIGTCMFHFIKYHFYFYTFTCTCVHCILLCIYNLFCLTDERSDETTQESKDDTELPISEKREKSDEEEEDGEVIEESNEKEQEYVHSKKNKKRSRNYSDDSDASYEDRRKTSSKRSRRHRSDHRNYSDNSDDYYHHSSSRSHRYRSRSREGGRRHDYKYSKDYSDDEKYSSRSRDHGSRDLPYIRKDSSKKKKKDKKKRKHHDSSSGDEYYRSHDKSRDSKSKDKERDFSKSTRDIPKVPPPPMEKTFVPARYKPKGKSREDLDDIGLHGITQTQLEMMHNIASATGGYPIYPVMADPQQYYSYTTAPYDPSQLVAYPVTTSEIVNQDVSAVTSHMHVEATEVVETTKEGDVGVNIHVVDTTNEVVTQDVSTITPETKATEFVESTQPDGVGTVDVTNGTGIQVRVSESDITTVCETVIDEANNSQTELDSVSVEKTDEVLSKPVEQKDPFDGVESKDLPPLSSEIIPIDPIPVPVLPPESIDPTPVPVLPPVSIDPTPVPVLPPVSIDPTPVPVLPPVSIDPTPVPVLSPGSIDPIPVPVLPPVSEKSSEEVINSEDIMECDMDVENEDVGDISQGESDTGAIEKTAIESDVMHVNEDVNKAPETISQLSEPEQPPLPPTDVISESPLQVGSGNKGPDTSDITQANTPPSNMVSTITSNVETPTTSSDTPPVVSTTETPTTSISNAPTSTSNTPTTSVSDTPTVPSIQTGSTLPRDSTPPLQDNPGAYTISASSTTYTPSTSYGYQYTDPTQAYAAYAQAYYANPYQYGVYTDPNQYAAAMNYYAAYQAAYTGAYGAYYQQQVSQSVVFEVLGQITIRITKCGIFVLLECNLDYTLVSNTYM